MSKDNLLSIHVKDDLLKLIHHQIYKYSKPIETNDKDKRLQFVNKIEKRICSDRVEYYIRSPS